MTEVLKFALLGVSTGALTALMALGIVLVYRGSGTINFANGAIGLWAAIVFWKLDGVPPLIGVVAGVLLAAALGAAMHWLVMRPLRAASPLARVIATLGVLVLLQGLATAVLPEDLPSVDAFLPQSSVSLPFDVVVGVDRLLMLAIALVLFGGLWATYRFTRFGVITTAVATNERIAAADGHSPDLIATINWAVGGALAGVAGIILVPLVGLNPGTLSLLVVPALAAGLVGGFSSFPLILAGALVIGIGQSEMSYLAPTRPGLATAVPFLLIVLVLLVRGDAIPLRSYVQDRLPRVGTGRVRLIPLAIAIGVGVLLIATLDTLWVAALTTTLIAGIIAASVVVVTGYAGQISLAQFTLAGAGAWAAGWAVTHWSVSFPVAIVIAIGFAVPVGLLFGLPALKTRGVTLAVASLALAYVVQQAVFSDPALTGGFNGFTTGDHRLFGLDVDATMHPQRYAFLVLGALAITMLLIANLRRGRSGLRLIAVRSNERAASSLGISVFGAKLFAFALGAGIAGLGGVLMAFRDPFVRLGSFDVFQSIYILLFAVIGGIGFVAGAVVAGLMYPGAIVAYVMSEAFGIDSFFDTWGGALLIVTLMSDPNGVVFGMSQALGRLRGLTGRLPAVPTRRRREPEIAEAEGVHRVAPATLEIRDLRVRFGSVTAVDGLSFGVEPGQILGIIGPNGAGKTTVIDAMSGYLGGGYEGGVTLNGTAIDGLRAHDRARAGLGRSFQSLELFEGMTVRENIRAASDPRDSRAYLLDLLRPTTPPLTSAATAAIREFGLTEDLDREPDELPHGRRHLVAMARAVAAEPSVLLLDEPAAGLDEAESRELGVLLRRLADEWGFAIVLIEHDVALVRAVCDRLVAIDFGREIASGDPAAVCDHPAVRQAYLGELDADEVAAAEGPATTNAAEVAP